MLLPAPLPRIGWMVLPLVLLTLGACAATPPPQTAPDAVAAPTGVSRIPTEYRKLEASAAQSPDWAINIPDDRDQQHYLVALSEYHASEQDAREEAMKNARKEYAQFTGVDVAEVDEVIRSMYGQASDVFDPTVAGRSKTTESTDARVSRIKAKQWYWERYQARKGQEQQGQVFKYWVLVTVPVDEYDRVQEFKRQQAAARDQEQARKEAAVAEELAGLLAIHQQQLATITEALNRGEVVLALNQIQAEWNRLFQAQTSFQERGPLFLAKLQALKDAQAATVGRLVLLRNALVLDTGRFSTACLLSSNRECLLPVWVFYRTGEHLKPLGNLPLVLQTSSGQTLARAASGSTGRAEFHLAAGTTGRLRLALDTDAGTLAGLDEAVIGALHGIEGYLTVAEPPNEFRESVGAAVNQLFSGPASRPLATERVIIGPATFAGSGQGSDFAIALQREIRQRLTRIPGLTVIEPKPRNEENVVRAIQTRGIAMVATDGNLPDLGSASVQALIDGAQAALEASYTLRGNEIWLDLSLREAATDKILAASAAVINRASLPAGLGLLSAPAGLAVPTQPGERTDTIGLEITSHLGNGRTYQEGEAISYFVTTDQDAYLLLIYQDAAGNLIRILPNRYSGNARFQAGRYLQIPGKSDRFEFVITPPFGQEKVWAFAASRPFPVLTGQELDNGLTLLAGNLNSLLQQLRSFGQAPGNSYGESLATITTVARYN